MNASPKDTAPYDVERVRRDFPILHQEVQGCPLAYLDSAASSQRPRAVLEALQRYATHDHSNVHRGVHTLSQRATDAFEGARDRIRRYINAASTREIVFVRGTTEAINLVAQSWGRPRLAAGDEILITHLEHHAAGDEILITHLEHHANIVPWQLLAAQTGAVLKVAPIDARGELDLGGFERLLGPKTRLVAVAHVSNALGTVLPLARITSLAHKRDVPVLADGAQAVPHARIDVRALEVDFYAFSGHKIYGPTGIGVLYGREALLAQMPPWQGGGDMIRSVSFAGSTWNELPWKFEAGTPHIAGAVGLAAAIDYLESLGIERVAAHEQRLLALATRAIAEIPGVRVIGTAAHKAAVLSFVMEGVHPHDIGTIADSEGVAIRTGHHCAMPLMERFGVPATARASFACYSNERDLERLVVALRKVREVFG